MQIIFYSFISFTFYLIFAVRVWQSIEWYNKSYVRLFGENIKMTSNLSENHDFGSRKN